MQLPISEMLDFYSKTMLLFEMATADIMDEYGLTLLDIGVLLYLNEQNNCGTAIGASRALRVTKTLASKAIASLMQKGYVIGEQSDNDKRNIYIRVLPAAQPVLKRLTEARRKCFDMATRDIPEQKLSAIKEALEKVSSNLDDCLID